MAPTEQAVWRTVSRKAADHDTMRIAMAAANRRAARTVSNRRVAYEPKKSTELPAWL